MKREWAENILNEPILVKSNSVNSTFETNLRVLGRNLAKKQIFMKNKRFGSVRKQI